MSEPSGKFKRRSALVLSLSALVIVIALWQAGFVNPWRIYRKLRIALHIRKETEFDIVESHLDDMNFAVLGHATGRFENSKLNDSQLRRLIAVMKRLGPYEDPVQDVHYHGGQGPDRWRKSDELYLYVWSTPRLTSYSDFHVFACSPRDRDAIREIIGDPAQYGIKDNFRMVGNSRE